jgi:hypothetical protein
MAKTKRSAAAKAVKGKAKPEARAKAKPKSRAAPASPGRHRIFDMPFARVYPLLVQKAERKGRTKAEVDEAIRWLTGYSQAALQAQIGKAVSFDEFFAAAPAMNPKCALITGTVCGVRVEDIPDPLMKNIRYLDKLIDELAKGRPMAKILRT